MKMMLLAVANLIIVLCDFTFMVTSAPPPPPPHTEPLIFLTLTRWENRTFSPRLFYVMMVRQQQQVASLNQVHQDPPPPYPFESPLLVPNKLDGNQIPSFFALRNSFNKKTEQDTSSDDTSSSGGGASASSSLSSTTQNILQTQIIWVRGNASGGGDGDDFFKFNETFDNGDRITFEITHDDDDDKPPPPSPPHILDEDMIVFKDNALLSNRRTNPGQGRSPSIIINSQNLHLSSSSTDSEEAQPQKRACSPQQIKPNNHYQKHPRAEPVVLTEKIPMLELTLKIVHSSSIKNDNLIFSPFSIANVLALLLLGASTSSDTFQELSKLLTMETKDENIDAKIHDKFNNLLTTIKYCSNPEVVLESANEIFTDTNFTLLPSFEVAAFKYYGATTKQFDFRTDAKGFQYHVNSWVRSKTKGKIQSIVDSPPSPLTTLALVNAIYFQGSWEIPFAPQITRDGIFRVDDKVNLTVKMMTNEITIPYIKTDAYQMIRLAYKGKDTALYIILPTAEGLDSLLELERNLNTDELEYYIDIMAHSKPRIVTVKIPKMRVESDGHLKNILSNLGVQSIFNVSSANFSRISPTPGLHVSSLLHRAIVDINEKGTEATAVTIATGDRTIDEIAIPFMANRPFLFFIHNDLVDTILFYGRVVRPKPLDDSHS